ncbi:MAG: hypothetical protein IJI14_01540 [Anaerolineaceae bacterium]|nr:hypothetical protein [Anaerolineaceae bacterium]
MKKHLLFILLLLFSFSSASADDVYRSWTKDIEYILSLDSLSCAADWLQSTNSGHKCLKTEGDGPYSAGVISCKKDHSAASEYDCSISIALLPDGSAAGVGGSCAADGKSAAGMSDYDDLSEAISLAYEDYVSPDGLAVNDDEWIEAVDKLYLVYRKQTQFSYWLFGGNTVVSRIGNVKGNEKNNDRYIIGADIFDVRHFLFS